MIKAVKMTVGLPFGLGNLEFEPNETEQRAAWILYVELMTRVPIQQIGPQDGLLREALDSMYVLFDVTRQVLREAGPDVVHGADSLGPVALEVLNKGLRPFISKWHRKLLLHEQKCLPSTSPLEHELGWEFAEQMRTELIELQQGMRVYADALGKIAGIK